MIGIFATAIDENAGELSTLAGMWEKQTLTLGLIILDY